MLLLHRLTPLFVGIVLAAGQGAFLLWPSHAVWIAVATVLLVLLGCWRLVRPAFDPALWALTTLPAALAIATFAFAFFFETDLSKLAAFGVTLVLVGLFTEYVFQYIHLPLRYEPHSLGHVSALVSTMIFFEAAVVLYGLRLFLHLPLFALIVCAAAVTFLLLEVVFLLHQTDRADRRRLVGIGTLLATELFVAIAALPTGWYTNAALLTVFWYAYLGLTRAELLRGASASLKRTYIWWSIGLAVVILATARWV